MKPIEYLLSFFAVSIGKTDMWSKTIWYTLYLLYGRQNFWEMFWFLVLWCWHVIMPTNKVYTCILTRSVDCWEDLSKYSSKLKVSRLHCFYVFSKKIEWMIITKTLDSCALFSSILCIEITLLNKFKIKQSTKQNSKNHQSCTEY